MEKVFENKVIVTLRVYRIYRWVSIKDTKMFLRKEDDHYRKVREGRVRTSDKFCVVFTVKGTFPEGLIDRHE